MREHPKLNLGLRVWGLSLRSRQAAQDRRVPLANHVVLGHNRT